MTPTLAIRHLLGAASLALLCGPLVPEASAAVGGANVTRVDVVDDAGDQWIYKKIGDHEWEEWKGDWTQHYYLEETGHDGVDVYLEDTDRGLSVTVDLDESEVDVIDLDGDARFRSITGSQATVKGFNVSRVCYGVGRTRLGNFASVDGSTWEERDTTGALLGEYRKTGEDEWSVYLTRTDRRVSVQLDLWQQHVVRGGSTLDILATWPELPAE